jgi:hypothetical protein
MNKRNRLVVSLAAFLVVVSIGIGTAIAVTLFYHHMPSVGLGATMTSNCDPLLADPPTVTVGSNGQETFWCSSSVSAMTVTGPVAAVPVFADSIRSPYTSLWLFKGDGTVLTGPCSGRTGAFELQNNTAMTVQAGNYNYCAEYVDVPPSGLRSFLCRWDA